MSDDVRAFVVKDRCGLSFAEVSLHSTGSINKFYTVVIKKTDNDVIHNEAIYETQQTHTTGP